MHHVIGASEEMMLSIVLQPNAPNLFYAHGKIGRPADGRIRKSVRPGNSAPSGSAPPHARKPKKRGWNGPFAAGPRVPVSLPPAASPLRTRFRRSSPCKLRQSFELAGPGRLRWAMTSSILLIGVRGSSGRACGREFATARVRSECRQGRSVFLAAPGREPFRQPDAVVLLRRLLHRAGNARSL